MTASLFRVVSRFICRREGVSAVEFAIGAPLIILLFLMGVDTTRFIIDTQRIDNVATTISQMLSQNTTGNVNYIDLQFYHDSASVIFPQVLSDAKQQNIPWSQDIGITMSSVKFTPLVPGCGSSCTYLPQVAWSGGTSPRSCVIPLIAASDTAKPSPLTLPQDVFGPASIIVVDITYSFRPTIAPSFMKNIPIRRSYYMSPRYVSLIKYQTISGDNGIAAPCPLFT